MPTLRNALTLVLLCLICACPLASAAEQWPYPNPVEKPYEDGKITVTVTVKERNFGYRVGERIRLLIEISAPEAVQINLEPITKGEFIAGGSDFVLVEPPAVTSAERDGMVIRTVAMTVRSWVTKPRLTFTSDFLYALGKLGTSEESDWKVVQTPPIHVTTSNTAPTTMSVILGSDLSSIAPPQPVLVWPLRIAGAICLLALPSALVLLLFRLARRVLCSRKRRAPSLNEQFWVSLRSVTDGPGRELSPLQAGETAALLRRYFGITSVPSSQVEEPLAEFFAGSGLPAKEKARLVVAAAEALRQCESCLFSKQPLSEKGALLERIGSIVPRR